MSRRFLFSLGALLFFTTAMGLPAEPATFRVFTSKDGRALEARILDYNSSTGKLLIERRPQGKAWVDPSVFSDEDQPDIEEWIAGYAFRSPALFKFSVQKKDVGKRQETREDRGYLFQFYIESMAYELTLLNHSKVPLRGLKAEFVVPIQVKDIASDETFLRYAGGEIELDAVPSGSKVTVMADAVDLVDLYRSYVRNGVASGPAHNISNDKLVGIWLRILSPAAEDEAVFRELIEPARVQDSMEWFPAWQAPVVGLRTTLLREWQDVQKSRPRNLEILMRGRFLPMLREETDPRRISYMGEILSELIAAKYPDQKGMYANEMGSRLYEYGVYPEAEVWLQQSLERGNSTACYALADIYSSAPDPAFHNAERAVELAEKYARTNRKNPLAKDLMARALARRGSYEEAVVAQEEAIALAERNSCDCILLSDFQARLELYKSGKPFTRGDGSPVYVSTPCFTRRTHDKKETKRALPFSL